MLNISQIYYNRFQNDIDSRNDRWQVLCLSYFQKYISPKDVVMDIGAGYCEFINNIHCSKKYAVDINPDTAKYAAPGVIFLKYPGVGLPQKYYGKMNVVFMSNFLEHLASKEEVIAVLQTARRLLTPTGKLIILQPNIDLTREKYWDFIDHKIALNGNSVIEALEISGFNKINFTKRFLPLTTKSALPQNAFLVKAYLSLPSFLRPFAGQSIFIAQSE